MYVMSETTKKNIERTVGISIERLNQMTPAEERSYIEKRTGRSLIFSKRRRHGVIGRGNPLLARRKIRRISDLDKKSQELFGV